MNLETYLSDKPKIINRSHKEYPEKFYQDIMDNLYLPINKIWIDDRTGRAGIYGSITNGKQRESYKQWLRYHEKKEGFYFL